MGFRKEYTKFRSCSDIFIYVFDNEEVGEMSLENSLPYDDISSVDFKPFDSTENIEMIQNFSKRFPIPI